MSFTTIEILATIVIVIAIVKIFALLFAPNWFVNFANRLWNWPKLLQTISLILAAVVLYFLIGTGVTIVEIFAVSLFIFLFLAVGLGSYGKTIVSLIDFKTVLKEQWLYALLWAVLMIWGIKEIFFV